MILHSYTIPLILSTLFRFDKKIKDGKNVSTLLIDGNCHAHKNIY